ARLVSFSAAALVAAVVMSACNGDGAATGVGGSVVPTPRSTPVAATATPAHPGQANYVTHCAACHGVSGEGQPNWFQPGPDGLLPAPPHDNYGHTWHHGDGYLFRVTKRGGAAFMMPGQQSNMPGFDVQMTDQEIIDVLEYIKGFWGKDEREFQASASAGDPYP
ncbi:MAG: cytochrome c, partial [Chloroflexota bacterium]|nr:cytochrome c [Chloroflexota bacterium]